MLRPRRVPALHVLRSLDRAIPHDSELPPLTPGELAQRPRTRGDCADGPRQRPWYSCRHHIGLDVHPSSGSVTLRIDPEQLDQAPANCALDLADRGGATLEAVGDILNVTRERVRQVEDRALQKLARRGGAKLLEHVTD